VTKHPNDDDRYAVALLRPLASEPSGPARLDVSRAMADGRRRRRSRWWAGGTAVVALTATTAAGGTLAFSAIGRPSPKAPITIATPTPSVTAAAPPAGPKNCKVTRLPTDGAKKALVTAGDPSGHWLVGRTYPQGPSRPFVVWKDGKLVATGETSGEDQSLEDINTKGVAVGYSFDPGVRPYSYRNGKVTAMAGGEAVPTAINDAGVVVGAVGPLYEGRPVRWKSVTAEPDRLPVPAGTEYGTATDIDEDGTILGTVSAKNKEATGYLWLADGSTRRMPLPVVDGVKSTMFWPAAIRNGVVVGRSVTDAGDSRTFAYFRYRLDTGRYERLPEGSGDPARVAANGWVLGEAQRPVVTTDKGVTTMLPKYAKAKGRQDYLVSSFSDDGKVVGGYAIGDDIQNQPLMWRCG
jgi:uncharacterized membrane protein